MTIEQLVNATYLNKRISIITDFYNNGKIIKTEKKKGIVINISIDGDSYGGFNFYFTFKDSKNLDDSYFIDLTDTKITIISDPINDIIGKGHKCYEGHFSCSQCLLWVYGESDDIDSYMKCSKLGKRDYSINDGDCPYSYNQYKALIR